jgi:hypothetical protein
VKVRLEANEGPHAVEHDNQASYLDESLAMPLSPRCGKREELRVGLDDVVSSEMKTAPPAGA